MDLPCTEIDLWALVFMEEQQELDGKKSRAPANQSTEEQIEQFKQIMRPTGRKRK